MSALSDLIDLFSKLPGLGPRSARRIVLYLLKNKERVIPNISEMLENLKTSAIFCKICGNIDTSSPCSICSDKSRKSEKVCVVEDIGDLWAIEKSRAYNGRYHVLGGVLSAIDGIGPDELNLISLFQRVKNGEIEELIIATNATMEGQITAQFIADSCKNDKLKITRLAQGMPIGGELDTLDYNTLSTAFDSRSEMKANH
ncbi:MAG: recombination protein RecR [Rickettsiales bacterium]|nr:recombination protein RecR [Rickettsiales bacterium]RPG14104.1 MAG: recombination protein RecR [Pelagibacteraceae bacterium TMED195]|tara:strand:+ start:5087 stop:5686 length:600 start_codon:yes stop_codon:yes gene_type:complete